MLNATHRRACPNCGAEVEFRTGGSRALVCGYCRFSIARLPSGGLASLGKIADLVPTDPALGVGDRGTLSGAPFVVLGRQQLDHGAGPWDEFFIAAENGDSRWLALAQGRWFVTSEADASAAPPIAALVLGQPIAAGPLAGFVPYELGRYRVLSAEGELPTPIRPGEAGAHADLEAAGDRFATLDEGGGERRLYVGHRIAASAVVITHRAAGLAPRGPEATRLRCGHCGAPIELTMPETTAHVGCASCGSVVDRGGAVVDAVMRDDRARSRTRLPLGREGTLLGRKVRIVGHLGKSCVVEGSTFRWDEYCLATEVGFAWLTEENGHCTFYEDAPRGRVVESGGVVSVAGETFALFSDVEAKVDSVVGEMPWQVRLGEKTRAREYIRPPRSVSIESSWNEITHSLGAYVPTADVYVAFGVPDRAPTPSGVGTTQPAPEVRSVLPPFLALFAVLLVGQCGLVAAGPSGELARASVVYPERAFSGRMESDPPAVTLIEDVVVPETGVLEVAIATNGLVNTWTESQIALVNQETGEIYEVELTTEAYSGVSGGESWSEGSLTAADGLSHVPAGRYFLRAESVWDRWPSDPFAELSRMPIASTITVERRAGSSTCCFVASAILVLLPIVFAVLRRQAFIGRRWSESNVTQSGSV